MPPPKCAIPKVEHLTNVQTDFLLQICNTSVPIIEKFICRSSILLLFFNLKKSGKNDKMWGKNYVIKKALVTFDTYLKFPLYMKTHFQRFFAHKHYFYMSYSGRNSHSRTVFSWQMLILTLLFSGWKNSENGHLLKSHFAKWHRQISEISVYSNNHLLQNKSMSDMCNAILIVIIWFLFSISI